MVTDENGKFFLKTRRSTDVLALLLLICNDCGFLSIQVNRSPELSVRTNPLK